MALPRIFISSTYYDMKNVRADLERYIRERGFEPVLNERGHIPYGSEERLEEYCYKEVQLCDILVSIIGGRYGSESSEGPYSISQRELKTALEIGRQIYIFVEKNVLAEYQTYKHNKENTDIKYPSVDDVRVFRFLDEVMSLPVNNPVAPFETSADITGYLQVQWAGLFQRLLQDAGRQKEVHLIEEMTSIIATLNRLVTFLSSEKTKGETAVRDILLTNHPIFRQLRSLLSVPYPVFLQTRADFHAWLGARGFRQFEEHLWDSPEAAEWFNDQRGMRTVVKIRNEVFNDDGSLKIFTPENWDVSNVTVSKYELTEQGPPMDDDDIPF